MTDSDGTYDPDAGKVHGFFVEEPPFHPALDGDWTRDVMPRGTEPVEIGGNDYDQTLIVCTAGPLAGYVAAHSEGSPHLCARSVEELLAVLRDPANHDEFDEVYLLAEALDSFADGRRTPEDLAAAASLESAADAALAEGFDRWDAPYVAAVEWATRLSLQSADQARELIARLTPAEAAKPGRAAVTPPAQWQIEGAQRYLRDLARWREAHGEG